MYYAYNFDPDNNFNLTITNLEKDKLNKILSILIDTNVSLGDTVNYGGVKWNVVDIDFVNHKAVLALHRVPFSIPFGMDNNYDESYLKKVCEQYQKFLGIKETIFVPTVEEINSYKWFKESESRMCEDAVCDNSNWWTSSQKDSSYSNVDYTYIMSSDGTMTYNYCKDICGFRPFVKISI